MGLETVTKNVSKKLRVGVTGSLVKADCRVMLCISTAYAIVQCLSIRLSVTFVDSVETTKVYVQKFFTIGSHTILVFPHQIL